MVGATAVGVVEPSAIAGQAGREIGAVAHIGTVINEITRSSTRISPWRRGRGGVVVDGDCNIGRRNAKVAKSTTTTASPLRNSLGVATG